jgi:hypothetical protein
MDSASCSADEEPGSTWPIVAPLLLLDRAPARGLVPRSSMNLQIQPVKLLIVPTRSRKCQYEQAKSSRTSGDHPATFGHSVCAAETIHSTTVEPLASTHQRNTFANCMLRCTWRRCGNVSDCADHGG